MLSRILIRCSMPGFAMIRDAARGFSNRSLYIPLLMLAALWGLSGSDRTMAADVQEIPFYIGTYTQGTSEGIYRSSLNLSNGSLARPELVAKLTNPSFLAIHPNLNVLYAVSEVGRGDRQVVAYNILASGQLAEINARDTGGDGPCYVTVDRTGRFVLVANYGSGSIASISLESNGGLGSKDFVVQHVGGSVHPRRQQGPHAHCILMDPSDQFVCAADLGLDQVLVYRLDRASGELTAAGQALKIAPGGGPRHIAFHPNGTQAYVLHEMTSKMSVCDWDSDSGVLKETQVLSTLPESFSGNNSTAEVLVHPSGKYVYSSNRGHHSIAAFQVLADGLQPIGHTPTGGKTPRNFRIDPTGQFLLTENQQSDTIFAFRIDLDTGELSQASQPISVGAPCCIKFLMR